jgi:hypothetical protein
MSYFGPSCPVSGYRSLAAGTVTMQVPGLASSEVQLAAFQEGQLGGLTAYQAALASPIRAGKYTVAGSGGVDVGEFQVALQIGADIQIQTPLTGSKLFGTCHPVTIDWTGGDPISWVTVSLVQQPYSTYSGYQFVNFAARIRASKGTVTFPGQETGVCLPVPNEVRIEVDPDPSEIIAFSAPGLSLGGRATWKYVDTFQVKPSSVAGGGQ